MAFPELKTEDGIPMIKAGVIFTALSDKGSVLKAALQKFGIRFSSITFIDDDRANLLSVQKFCDEEGISFEGIHYRASRLSPLPSLTEEVEQIRYRILETEKRWLSDDELKSRLSKL